MVASPARRSDVAWVEVDGDVVAMAPSGDIHVLQGAAAALWQVIDGESIEGLDEAVALTFGISRERAAADIKRALAMLAEIGIIESPPAP